MTRSVLSHRALTLALAASASLASAQTSAPDQNTPQTLRPEKISGAVKHAGTYHVSTGTWTRIGGAVANFGPDVIYSNTAPSGYFSSAGGAGGFAAGATNYDEGNVPTSANTNNAGNRDDYLVNCVTIGYCDMGAAGSGGWELGFYTGYAPCAGAAIADSTIQTAGLPANGCWFVSFDLSGGGEICLAGDGGNGFDDVPSLDSFGWSFRYTGTDGSQPAGFLLTGDPESTDPSWVPGGLALDGTNTYFGPPSLCGPDQATGLLTEDQWYVEDPTTPANDGCYWFGGYLNNNGCGGPSNPFASWYLELEASLDSCTSGGSYCLSNPNSTGVNSTMTISGSPSVAANDVTLTASIPANSFGFFITSQFQGFIPNPGGSAGNICLGMDVGRFQQLAANSGASGMISISTTAGQWSLTSIPQASGPYAAMAGGTANFQCWHRD
ncbi:MAG: hypothetical protein AAGG01_09455, partial [Planctomycetota bacterium]